MVFALGRALVRLGDERGERAGRLAFGQLYLLVFAAFGFALSTVFVLMTGDARFAPLAPLALALGAFLDEALEGERAEPVLGLLAGTGTMVVARDLFLAPEEIPSLHVLTKVKWPPQLRVAPGFLAVGLVVALGIYLGLATRGRALGKVALRDIGTAPVPCASGWNAGWCTSAAGASRRPSRRRWCSPPWWPSACSRCCPGTSRSSRCWSRTRATPRGTRPWPDTGSRATAPASTARARWIDLPTPGQGGRVPAPAQARRSPWWRPTSWRRWTPPSRGAKVCRTSWSTPRRPGSCCCRTAWRPASRIRTR